MATRESSDGLSSSFTDLMTSLAVIFILLLVAFWNNKQQELAAKDLKLQEQERILLAKATSTEDTRLKLLRELRLQLKELVERGIEVEADRNDPLGLLVVVPEGLLDFGRGLASIPAGAEDFLNEFIPRLALIACSFRGDLNSIVVEGHTSSEGEEEYNLKLSQDRSISVVRHSLDVLAHNRMAMLPIASAPVSRIENVAVSGTETIDLRECFLDLLSASGRGRRELFLVDGVEDMERSRRVVFKIRVRSFEQRGTR